MPPLHVGILTFWFTKPYAEAMDLQVPPELEEKLNRLAARTGRTADQVALDLLSNSVEHDEWFRAEIEKVRLAASEGRLLDHQEVRSRLLLKARRF
jgi:predicted transcriptional regulator